MAAPKKKKPFLLIRIRMAFLTLKINALRFLEEKKTKVVHGQIGTMMVVEADYAFTATRHSSTLPAGNNTLDVNLAYNPVTGYNYPFTDRTRKPYARYGWDQVNMTLTEARDNYHSLQMSFTKRLSDSP